MNIWAIPGFLGIKEDWDFLKLKKIIPIDWQSISWKSLNEWGINFNSNVAREIHSINVVVSKKSGLKFNCKAASDAFYSSIVAKAMTSSQIAPSPTSRFHLKTLFSDTTPNILMGYSFGGRLGLHALIQQPHLWHAGIIISAHPGLSHPKDREKRLYNDQIWAKRFEKENWETLISDWNRQPIFSQDSASFTRKENDYQRTQLMKALTLGSLGIQKDLTEQIAQLPMPILWLTGERDLRFCQITQKLQFAHPQSQWQKIGNAGHRLPWSQPEIFSDILRSFLNQIIPKNIEKID